MLLLESYDYNCLMVQIAIANYAERFKTIINPEHVYNVEGDDNYGIETNPHITVLYGIHPEITLYDIMNLNLPNINDLDLNLTKIDSFNSEKYDVLKFNIVSKELTKLNKLIKSSVPFTSKYDEYNPHMTIAYLKPGTAVNYCSKSSKNIKLKASRYSYSLANGMKYTF